MQIIPTLGRKVCKYYRHRAISIPRVRVEEEGFVDQTFLRFQSSGLSAKKRMKVNTV